MAPPLRMVKQKTPPPSKKIAKKDDTASKSSSKIGSLKKMIFGGNSSSAGKGKKSAAPARPAAAPSKGVRKAPEVNGKGAADTRNNKHAIGGHPAKAVQASTGKANGKSGGSSKAAGGKKGHDAASRAVAALNKAKGMGPVSRLSGDSAAESVCREVACENLATTNTYCRLHYIKNWKKIKRKGLILKEGKLNQYIEELVAKYPDKYIEAIRQDLAHDKDFAKVIIDLDLDEGVDDFDVEGGENVESIIDNIKRDFEDEGDF